MMRKLASIRMISDILPIDGADAIECVVVDGWKVVTKKDEFQKGDLCIYFEIDSVLPVWPEFEFLRKGCYVKKDWLVSELNPTGEGFRLKTIKLRGQISQGLVVPIPSDFPYSKMTDNGIETITDYDGMDVTEYFKVIKWDPPVPATLAGKVRGNFPSFIPKTDQERIQNIKPEDLAKYEDDEFEVTMKLDGSSMTVFHYNGRVGVCSRNLELDWESDSGTTFADVFVKSGLKDWLLNCGQNIALQGELMGPGIQGNREALTEHRFYLFDVYDIDTGQYVTSEDRHELVALREHFGLDIQHCPVIDTKFHAAKLQTEELLTMAEGPSIFHKVREGLVFKSIQNPDFSFKAINNQFLLCGGE